MPVEWRNTQGTWERLYLGEAHITVVVDAVRGQGRPRLGKRGAYELPADKAAKRQIADAWRAVYGGALYYMQCSEIEVDIVTSRRLPKSAPKWQESSSDNHKPDVDNIAKLVLDALTGVAWAVDDAAVTKLTAAKDRRKYQDHEYYDITVRYYTNVFSRKGKSCND